MKKILITALVLLGVGGGLLFNWSSGSVSITQQAQQASVKGASTDDTKVLTFPYLSLVVPSRFQLKNDTQSPQKPLLLQQLYIARESAASVLFGDQMAITIGDLMGGSIQDVSDVVLRQRSDAYMSLPTRLANTYVFESKVMQYEIGVFVASDNKYVGIVLSGPLAKQAQLKKELEAVVSSIIWQ